MSDTQLIKNISGMLQGRGSYLNLLFWLAYSDSPLAGESEVPPHYCYVGVKSPGSSLGIC